MSKTFLAILAKIRKTKLKFYQENMVFCKNQRNRIEILSRKHNDITKK